MASAGSLLDTMADEEAEEMAIAIWMQMVSIAVVTSAEETKTRGSRPGRAENLERTRERGNRQIMLDYFWPSSLVWNDEFGQKGPVYSEVLFERRFRMPRAVFDRLFAAVVARSAYLRSGLRVDATGRLGASPLQKVVAALRQLAYGAGADNCDEYCRIGESTALRSMKELCEAVVEAFGAEWLRAPTSAELLRIEASFSRAGFPGCIGCLDCAGWEWHMRPKALQGIHSRKEGKPTLRLEVICDLDLHIWHAMFGMHGMMNDLNILTLSTHFAGVLAGRFPPVEAKYEVHGEQFNWLYYLADGIYPSWKIFIKWFSSASSEAEKTFSANQEAARKCVERVFGDLFKRFSILCIPGRLWAADDMRTVLMACVAIHNMIVDVRRHNYKKDGVGETRYDGPPEANAELISLPAADDDDIVSRLRHMANVSDDTKSKSKHKRLLNALVKHQWRKLGDD